MTTPTEILDRLDRDMARGLEGTLIHIARQAGQALLEIYHEAHEQGLEIDRKADDSPLTEADLASNRAIVQGLDEATPEIPILSEESAQAPYDQRRGWDLFWLVDPLDGTKEFIKANGEFTVNIALVHGNRPIAGVVHAPDLEATYYGQADTGAFKLDAGAKRVVLETLVPEPDEALGVVVSRSHLNDATRAFVDALDRPVELVRSGSSLKFCRIAEGQAHLYPRLAPTMEWDTGAAQAVLEAAGGVIVQASGESAGKPLVYNKQELLNPHFIAAASSSLLSP